MFIKYRNGTRLQGILVALGDQLIRVAIKDADDAAIFRLVSGVWVSEDCEVVTFEFPLAIFEAIGIAPSGKETSLAAPVAEVQPCAGEVFIN